MIKMRRVGHKGRKVLACGCLVKKHSVWKSYDLPDVNEGKGSYEWIEARRRAAKLAGTIMRFGYNPDSLGEGGWFADAISNLQLFHGIAVTGTLDQATVEKIALPICAHLMFYKIKNKSEHDLTILQGWPVGRDTLYYSFGEGIGSADFEFTHVESAIGKWNNEGKVKFEPATIMHPPDIEIGWTSPDSDGDNLVWEGAVAHADLPPPNGSVSGVKPVHFSNAESWTGALIESVALHELGHILGFRDIYNENSVMYPVFNSSSVIEDMDKKAYAKLYPHL